MYYIILFIKKKNKNKLNKTSLFIEYYIYYNFIK